MTTISIVLFIRDINVHEQHTFFQEHSDTMETDYTYKDVELYKHLKYDITIDESWVIYAKLKWPKINLTIKCKL